MCFIYYAKQNASSLYFRQKLSFFWLLFWFLRIVITSFVDDVILKYWAHIFQLIKTYINNFPNGTGYDLFISINWSWYMEAVYFN